MRGKSQKIGIYIDAVNSARNGGFGRRFDLRRDFACRDGGEPVRLNAYVAHDEEKAKTDKEYKENPLNFYAALRDFGYKVIEKPVMWYVDEPGSRAGQAHAALD